MTDTPDESKESGAVELQEVEPPPPMTDQRARSGQRGWMFRLMIIATILVVICGVVAFSVFQVNRASRNSPIEVEVYPGAKLIPDGETKSNNADSRVFSTPDTTAAVFSFYLTRLGTDESRGCKKIYLTAKPDDMDPTKWFGRCVVDNSQDDRSQWLKITIQWDAANTRTLLKLERAWGS